jgi:hypothetical protein
MKQGIKGPVWEGGSEDHERIMGAREKDNPVGAAIDRLREIGPVRLDERSRKIIVTALREDPADKHAAHLTRSPVLSALTEYYKGLPVKPSEQEAEDSAREAARNFFGIADEQIDEVGRITREYGHP